MSRSFSRGLWSLIRRMFGAPQGRHVVGAPTPAESPAPSASAPPDAAPEVAVAPEIAPAPEVASEVAVAPQVAVAAVQALPQGVPTTSGVPTIRLIFTDGSVVPLLEGSVEGRQAQYLARRVLEAGQRS